MILSGALGAEQRDQQASLEWTPLLLVFAVLLFIAPRASVPIDNKSLPQPPVKEDVGKQTNNDDQHGKQRIIHFIAASLFLREKLMAAGFFRARYCG